jgi:hypothetical protein
MKAFVIRYGLIAGVIVAIPMLAYWLSLPADAILPPATTMMVATYAVMLVALTLVFVGIKQYRDRVLGGVIRFGPALLVGLAISAIAGLCYAFAWEICRIFGRFDFTAMYATTFVEEARARGADAAGMAAAAEQAAQFTQMYANPLFRIPMTFLEIFPVGVLVTLISAALLRNSRFMPVARSA